MKRLHNTYKPLRLQPQVREQRVGMKPSGLWYSIDYEWLEWCKYNMPNWVHSHTYELELDLPNILVVRKKDLASFIRQYKGSPCSGATFGSDICMDIKWPAVAREYSGIEIRDYERGYHSNALWLSSWDCSSGCVWDTAAIKKVTKLRRQYVE